ncbi:MAG: aminoacyl-tRNA hydrolase [Candidatus Woykebacteria bacterium GWB1_45_5]|uniref:Peptidyl-tRNA hydrolase n=2 Tax=Candidatus Woykeibacteriota TaxID=1817899 RepID=A0A1G1W364_9BACT|nr:MAG: aminoacyl-tRNA hydrolase [Candidatus Woykebacteria bacterium GWA1_44_8]OGY22646.1 MAG: aminoacyl-tRNA hydrolase [Candidatus Woykebacteria bacterium GWB1_45_5]
MKVAVGLGNPGQTYAKNRHNVGFFVIDEILKQYVAGPQVSKKLQSILYFLDKKRILVKPQTFMNASGKAVNRAVNYYKVKPEGLLVVHDDVDLEFGEIKHQFGRGSAGHKGVESVIDALGSDQFNRVRVGIGRPNIPIETEDWVLQNFSEDSHKVQELIERASEVVINWLKE